MTVETQYTKGQLLAETWLKSKCSIKPVDLTQWQFRADEVVRCLDAYAVHMNNAYILEVERLQNIRHFSEKMRVRFISLELENKEYKKRDDRRSQEIGRLRKQCPELYLQLEEQNKKLLNRVDELESKIAIYELKGA